MKKEYELATLILVIAIPIALFFGFRAFQTSRLASFNGIPYTCTYDLPENCLEWFLDSSVENIDIFIEFEDEGTDSDMVRAYSDIIFGLGANGKEYTLYFATRSQCVVVENITTEVVMTNITVNECANIPYTETNPRIVLPIPKSKESRVEISRETLTVSAKDYRDLIIVASTLRTLFAPGDLAKVTSIVGNLSFNVSG